MKALILAFVLVLTSCGADKKKESSGNNRSKPDAVTTGKIAKDAVTSSHIRNGSLRGRDFADGELGGIVARARGNQPVQTADPGAAYPLTGGTWTQEAKSLNLIYGRASIAIPDNCEGPETPDNVAGVDISIDGYKVGGTSGHNGGKFGPILLWEPGNDVQHTMTATGGDACDNDVHATVNSVEVDVVAFR